MAILLDNAHLLKESTIFGVNFAPSLDPKHDKSKLEHFAEQVRTTNHRLFNRHRFDATAPNGQQSVLLFERDILLKGVGQAKSTPLLLFPNFLELGLIYRLPEARGIQIDHQEYPRDTDIDKLFRTIMRQFWEIFSADVNRIGKVYECIWGPFPEDDVVGWTMQRFLRSPPGDLTLVTANATYLFTERDCNVTFIVAPGQSSIGPVLVTKLDINNVDQTQRIDQAFFDQLLNTATEIHQQRFNKLLGATP